MTCLGRRWLVMTLSLKPLRLRRTLGASCDRRTVADSRPVRSGFREPKHLNPCGQQWEIVARRDG